MRINNKRVNVYIDVIYTLMLIGLFFSILLIFIPIPLIVKKVPAYLLVLGFLWAIYGFHKLGHQNVEYSSDGEVINIKTQDPFWVKYFPQSKLVMDFPKTKLVNYKIRRDLFTKKLDLYVTSKRAQNGLTRLTSNITYLSKGEVNDLNRSLKKITKKNEELKNSTQEEVA